jgi:Predicted 3'-5' exonuclease related to the exonuclease domain of PolB
MPSDSVCGAARAFRSPPARSSTPAASIVSTLPGRCRARDLIEQKPQGARSPAPIVSAARAAKPSTPARSKAGTSVSAASTRPSAWVIVNAGRFTGPRRRHHRRGVEDALGAPHVAERAEKQLIGAFCDRIAELKRQTFNGNTFDLPVVRYRAMVQGVSAPGLAACLCFNCYTDDARRPVRRALSVRSTHESLTA